MIGTIFNSAICVVLKYMKSNSYIFEMVSFQETKVSLDKFVFMDWWRKENPFSKLNIKINLGGKAKWTKENLFKI